MSSTPSLRRPLPGFGEIGVSVTDAAGRTRRWCLLAARTGFQHRRGLMEVRDPTLGGYDGMVFIFDEDRATGFWMRNTPMPLSIAFHDGGGRLVSTADMEPCADAPGCPLYRPTRPYRFAVEVPRGGLGRLGIGPGAVLRPGGGCATT